jgi:hypothetical protein
VAAEAEGTSGPNTMLIVMCQASVTHSPQRSHDVVALPSAVRSYAGAAVTSDHPSSRLETQIEPRQPSSAGAHAILVASSCSSAVVAPWGVRTREGRRGRYGHFTRAASEKGRRVPHFQEIHVQYVKFRRGHESNVKRN